MSQIPNPNPELMVIGDSLSQGCRSFTVRRNMCAQSYGARIARSQGWSFRAPDFPADVPILFDLEDEIRAIDLLTVPLLNSHLKKLERRVRDNLRFWLGEPKVSAHEGFDNLGLTGCMVFDLFERSANSSREELKRLLPQGAETALPIAKIGDLHLALNALFTLNPSREQEFDKLTPMDWVRLRTPKRLIVHPGHNHGLYSIGGSGKTAAIDGNRFWESMEELAKQLAALPSAVSKIYYLLLPKISSVANLQPIGDLQQGYAEAYEPVFAFEPAVLTRKQMQDADREIEAANKRITSILQKAEQSAGNGTRLEIVDTFEVFGRFDFKNSRDKKRRIDAGKVDIDNRYLRINQVPITNPKGTIIGHQTKISAGGFQSVDGMHPTGCGYAVFASELMTAMKLDHSRAKLLSDAFNEDRLLSDTPIEIELVRSALGMLRNMKKNNQDVIQPRPALDDTPDVGLVDAVKMSQTIARV